MLGLHCSDTGLSLAVGGEKDLLSLIAVRELLILVASHLTKKAQALGHRPQSAIFLECLDGSASTWLWSGIILTRD